jgi:DNA-binding MarR family transcriptional regulator
MTDSAPTREVGVLDELVCFDLYVASRAMTRRYRPLLDRHGITYPQYLVVLQLGGRGASTIKDVAEALRLDHATLTPLIRRMETHGLVERRTDPADRRSVLLSLSAQGRRVHAEADAVQCTISDDLGLSPDEARELQGVLRRIEVSMDAALAADEETARA